jgi:hypothetical protein
LLTQSLDLLIVYLMNVLTNIYVSHVGRVPALVYQNCWFWFQLIRTELELDLDFIILRTRPGTVISELKLKYMSLKKWLESSLTSS